MGGICSIRRGSQNSGNRPREVEDNGNNRDGPYYLYSDWGDRGEVTNVGGQIQGGSEDGGGGVDGIPGDWSDVTVQQLVRLYQNYENSCAGDEVDTRTPVSLLDLCVWCICINLPRFGEFPSLLPREVVTKLLTSLTKHKALSCPAVHSFKACEVTELSLGGCRGVKDWWIRPLLEGTPCGRYLVILDLSWCTDLTDSGLWSLGSLPNLCSASLRHCRGLGETFLTQEGVAGCPRLERLSLGYCPRVWDGTVLGLAEAGLQDLRCLDLEGCEGITDASLVHAAKLPALTKLNVARCHQLTPNGLSSLREARGLQQLNLGWCQNLAQKREDEGGEGKEESQERESEWNFPVLPKLKRLCLASCGISSREVVDLASNSRCLTELNLSGCLLDFSGVDLSALLSFAKGLTSLDLSRCKGISQFEVSPDECMLRTLNLACTRVSDAVVSQIAQLAGGLTSLNLDSCEVGDVGMRALAALTNLEVLNLSDTGVTNAGLVGLYPLKRLRWLNLFFCNISDLGLGPVAQLTGLTSLNLDTRDIGDAGLAQLVRLKSLQTLDVFTSSISDFGIVHAVCRLSSLTSLEACSGRITDRGVQHLSRLTGLRRLNLSQNTLITAVGVARVGSMLTKLQSLNLSYCKVTSASLKKLTGLVNLESFTAFGCDLVRSDLESLQRSLPNLRVIQA